MKQLLLDHWIERIQNAEEFAYACFREFNTIFDPIGHLLDIYVEEHLLRWEGSLPQYMNNNRKWVEFGTSDQHFREWAFGEIHDPQTIHEFFVELMVFSDRMNPRPTKDEIIKFIQENHP